MTIYFITLAWHYKYQNIYSSHSVYYLAAMNSITVNCCVCLGRATIYNNDQQELLVLPLIVLQSCLHALCTMCLKRMRKSLIVKCPLCRSINIKYSYYCISGNTVNVVSTMSSTDIEEVKCPNISSTSANDTVQTIDIVSLAKDIYKSSVTSEDSGVTTNDNTAYDSIIADQNKHIEELIEKTTTLQSLLDKQTKLLCEKNDLLKTIETNVTRQQIKLEKLQSTWNELETKINNHRADVDRLMNAKSECTREYEKMKRDKNNIQRKNMELLRYRNTLQCEIDTLEETKKSVNKKRSALPNIDVSPEAKRNKS